MTETERTTSKTRAVTLCWQGWRMDLPARWDPVKLDGDVDRGMMLLADLTHPQLGIRWLKLNSNADVGKSISRAMLDEVGKLAAAEAVDAAPLVGDWTGGKLYLEPDPPGRDVWIGYSRSTGRMFQIVHHTKNRSRAMTETVLATLVDGLAGDWSIFDLSCRTPPGAILVKQQLNVGDLRLDFTLGRQPLVVRQIAVASVALARQTPERWVMGHQVSRKKRYRPTGKIEPIEWTINGQPMQGVKRVLTRRRRYFFLWKLPKTLTAVALHDTVRDRLLIVESTDEPTLRRTLESIGWAQKDQA